MSSSFVAAHRAIPSIRYILKSYLHSNLTVLFNPLYLTQPVTVETGTSVDNVAHTNTTVVVACGQSTDGVSDDNDANQPRDMESQHAMTESTFPCNTNVLVSGTHQSGLPNNQQHAIPTPTHPVIPSVPRYVNIFGDFPTGHYWAATAPALSSSLTSSVYHHPSYYMAPSNVLFTNNNNHNHAMASNQAYTPHQHPHLLGTEPPTSSYLTTGSDGIGGTGPFIIPFQPQQPPSSSASVVVTDARTSSLNCAVPNDDHDEEADASSTQHPPRSLTAGRRPIAVACGGNGQCWSVIPNSAGFTIQPTPPPPGLSPLPSSAAQSLLPTADIPTTSSYTFTSSRACRQAGKKPALASGLVSNKGCATQTDSYEAFPPLTVAQSMKR